MHDKNTFKNILDVRLDWQKKFMTKSDHKFNLNFFYENVKLKISSCLN